MSFRGRGFKERRSKDPDNWEAEDDKRSDVRNCGYDDSRTCPLNGNSGTTRFVWSIEYGWIRSWNLLRWSSRAICSSFWSFISLEEVHTKWYRGTSRYKITLERVRDESESTSIKDEMENGKKKKKSNIRTCDIRSSRLNGTSVRSSVSGDPSQFIQQFNFHKSIVKRCHRVARTERFWTSRYYEIWNFLITETSSNERQLLSVFCITQAQWLLEISNNWSRNICSGSLCDGPRAE